MKIIFTKFFLVVLLLMFSASITVADSLPADCNGEISIQDRNKSLWKVNITGIAVITGWGIAKWDYFTTSPQSGSEGWFGNDTKSGGSDKLGHLYTSYLLTHGLSNFFQSKCFSQQDAATYGALSTLAIVAYMEVGDSFSHFGFSKEDIVANSIGISYGYLSYKYPKLANLVDIRWQYKPNKETLGDFVTDYENSKFLLALKLNGFDFARDSFLKHIELHTGYYTRGFNNPDVTKERNIFFAISLNLTDLFRRHSYNKTSTLLKYYQIPDTSLEKTIELND